MARKLTLAVDRCSSPPSNFPVIASVSNVFFLVSTWPKNLICLVAEASLYIYKFRHFGIIRFWVSSGQTNRQSLTNSLTDKSRSGFYAAVDAVTSLTDAVTMVIQHPLRSFYMLQKCCQIVSSFINVRLMGACLRRSSVVVSQNTNNGNVGYQTNGR